MYNTITNTSTYTVVDIRKTFEGFDADLRMIIRRTGKESIEFAEKVIHDVLKLAEAKYLLTISIVLLNFDESVVQATKYKINETGQATSSDRAGENDWHNIPNTKLTVILAYTKKWAALTVEERQSFCSNNGFKFEWSPTKIDNTFSKLNKTNAQLYASKGYEIQKENYK